LKPFLTTQVVDGRGYERADGSTAQAAKTEVRMRPFRPSISADESTQDRDVHIFQVRVWRTDDYDAVAGCQAPDCTHIDDCSIHSAAQPVEQIGLWRVVLVFVRLLIFVIKRPPTMYLHNHDEKTTNSKETKTPSHVCRRIDSPSHGCPAANKENYIQAN
jgi:hypothetical protein